MVRHLGVFDVARLQRLESGDKDRSRGRKDGVHWVLVGEEGVEAAGVDEGDRGGGEAEGQRERLDVGSFGRGGSAHGWE